MTAPESAAADERAPEEIRNTGVTRPYEKEYVLPGGAAEERPDRRVAPAGVGEKSGHVRARRHERQTDRGGARGAFETGARGPRRRGSGAAPVGIPCARERGARTIARLPLDHAGGGAPGCPGHFRLVPDRRDPGRRFPAHRGHLFQPGPRRARAAAGRAGPARPSGEDGSSAGSPVGRVGASLMDDGRHASGDGPDAALARHPSGHEHRLGDDGGDSQRAGNRRAS